MHEQLKTSCQINSFLNIGKLELRLGFNFFIFNLVDIQIHVFFLAILGLVKVLTSETEVSQQHSFTKQSVDLLDIRCYRMAHRWHCSWHYFGNTDVIGRATCLWCLVVALHGSLGLQVVHGKHRTITLLLNYPPILIVYFGVGRMWIWHAIFVLKSYSVVTLSSSKTRFSLRKNGLVPGLKLGLINKMAKHLKKKLWSVLFSANLRGFRM